ncbi:MAG: hypothetical protein IJY09_08025 [Lachnospiraceae bacterium]|nr:hypothetical protein [Lachnospiraceae bacterium]
MKRKLMIALVALMVMLTAPLVAKAADSEIDTGGSAGYGDASEDWAFLQTSVSYGVRVSVVNKNGTVIAGPMDFLKSESRGEAVTAWFNTGNSSQIRNGVSNRMNYTNSGWNVELIVEDDITGTKYDQFSYMNAMPATVGSNTNRDAIIDFFTDKANIEYILSHIPGGPNYAAVEANEWYLMLEDLIITRIAPQGERLLVVMSAADAAAYINYQQTQATDEIQMTQKAAKITRMYLPYGLYIRKECCGVTPYANPNSNANLSTSGVFSAVSGYGLGVGFIWLDRTLDMPPAHLVRYIDTNENQKCDAKDVILDEDWEAYIARGAGESVTANSIYQYNQYKGVNRGTSTSSVTYAGRTYKLDSGYVSTSQLGRDVVAGPAEGTAAWSISKSITIDSPEYFYFVGYVDPMPDVTIKHLDEDGNELLPEQTKKVIEGAKGGVDNFFSGEPQETLKIDGKTYTLIDAEIQIGKKSYDRGKNTPVAFLKVDRELTGDTVYTLIYEEEVPPPPPSIGAPDSGDADPNITPEPPTPTPAGPTPTPKPDVTPKPTATPVPKEIRIVKFVSSDGSDRHCDTNKGDVKLGDDEEWFSAEGGKAKYKMKDFFGETADKLSWEDY